MGIRMYFLPLLVREPESVAETACGSFAVAALELRSVVLAYFSTSAHALETDCLTASSRRWFTSMMNH